MTNVVVAGRLTGSRVRRKLRRVGALRSFPLDIPGVAMGVARSAAVTVLAGRPCAATNRFHRELDRVKAQAVTRHNRIGQSEQASRENVVHVRALERVCEGNKKRGGAGGGKGSYAATRRWARAQSRLLWRRRPIHTPAPLLLWTRKCSASPAHGSCNRSVPNVLLGPFECSAALVGGEERDVLAVAVGDGEVQLRGQACGRKAM
eukprot:scaffold221845_cov29-Tisochrysis_lutea.AAC.2